MWKQYSAKTHIWTFDSKDYDKEKMYRYWKMINSIQWDAIIDSEDLTDAIHNIKSILEKEVIILMKKWYTMPKID